MYQQSLNVSVKYLESVVGAADAGGYRYLLLLLNQIKRQDKLSVERQEKYSCGSCFAAY